ncbi:MAG TPA: hypothetical protein VEL28_17335 [Candidatus Binatia bacterium]|nr:hypothetical protein [Candidatus Binatia bacterium]
MNLSRKMLSAAAITMSLVLTGTVHAQTAPLQADETLEVPGADGQGTGGAALLDGGGARMRIRIVNRDDSRTALVRLRFRYDIPPDTIALDEIIDRIIVETSSDDGAIGRIDLDPHEVNLNPNGPRLRYELTLYRPEGEYDLRVRVFGNYE